MHLATVKISGFKSIPFCASYTENGRSPQIQWNQSCFSFPLPTSHQNNLLTAVIGANSTGKSNILYALEAFFENKTKLPLDCFNNKSTNSPVIIEVEFVREKAQIDRIVQENQCSDFVSNYCQLTNGFYHLQVGLLWPAPDQGGRFYYIRKPDQSCSKVTSTQEKKLLAQHFFPAFRIIKADSRLQDEANSNKTNLLQELIDDVLQEADPDPENVNRRNVAVSIRKKLDELKTLVNRTSGDRKWRFLLELEKQISDSLGNVTPGSAQIEIDISHSIPQINDLFHSGKVRILDGIELDFDKQGLGLQRSFVLALLRTWCKRIGDKSDDRDYLFAIEEPEIYLHPHATRVMLNTLQSIAKSHQVIYTTHSGEFVNRTPLENIFLIRREGTMSTITVPDFSNLPHKSDLYKVRRHLQESRSDALFARSVLLVEGQSEWYALPDFARTLSMDLDGQGVSVVCTHGKGNFKTYHLILRQLGIPHVIMGDGDGKRADKIKKYTSPPFQLPNDRVFVLEHDFERELVTKLTDDKICSIINSARKEIGKGRSSRSTILTVPSGQARDEYLAKKLKKLGKPLIGRIAGNKLSRVEIHQLDCIESALSKVLEIAKNP